MGVEDGAKGPQNGEFKSSTADALKDVQAGAEAEAEDIWGDADQVQAIADQQRDSERSRFGKFMDRRRTGKEAKAAAAQAGREFEAATAAVDPANEAIWGEAGTAEAPVQTPVAPEAVDMAAWNQPISAEDEAIWDQPIPGTEPTPVAQPAAEAPITQEEVEAVDWDQKF